MSTVENNCQQLTNISTEDFQRQFEKRERILNIFENMCLDNDAYDAYEAKGWISVLVDEKTFNKMKNNPDIQHLHETDERLCDEGERDIHFFYFE